ncbi:hypothetical protein ACFRCQ_15275 [Cytobacillus firmus]|uniref:hypothetical protein n=1 Tax=Cytobacillus firmus TaxID=1399 RepID=UPI0036A5E2A6
MKVKTLVAVPSRIGHIQSGWEFDADLVDQFYVVKDGFFAGCKIHKCACEVVKPTYSEKEWNDMENHYMAALDKERQEKERAQQMVHELTVQINNKNKEIEKLNFFVECSNLALRASCQAIETLKESKIK